MATLKDLINSIENEDMKFQLLSQGNLDLKIRGKAKKHLEVTFHTDESHMIGKEGLVIWVDKDKFDLALRSIKKQD